MNTEQIELAISFLENPQDRIVMQYQFEQDLQQIKHYLLHYAGFAGTITYENRIRWDTARGHITFEHINEHSGTGYNCPIFLIERQHENRQDGDMI